MCYEEKRRLVQADRLLQLAIVVQEEDTWFTQRVDRVPGFLSSRPNWLPPPLNRNLVLPPHLVPRAGHTRLGERGWGTNTLLL